MTIESIGENAGKIWEVLNGQGQLNATTIKKKTGLNDKNLFLALGWLAREGKLTVEQKGNVLWLGLKE